MKAARVIPPRILPVVIAAATGLLTLKTLGLVTQGGYVLQPGEGSGFARGLSQPRRDPAWASGDDITGASSAPKAPAAPKQEEPGRKADPNQPLPTPLPTAAEREVLENLGSRRKALDERSKELDLREQLLKSAEKLTQERLDELKQAEARIEREAAKPSPELKALLKRCAYVCVWCVLCELCELCVMCVCMCVVCVVCCVCVSVRFSEK